MSVFLTALNDFKAGRHPEPDVMEAAIVKMLGGDANDAQIAAFLFGLEIVGVRTEDLITGAKIMRQHMTRVKFDAPLLDIVGTGGDGLSTYNVSTAAAIVAAAAGAKVAKHGSRAVSSKSGASDVLTELGVDIDASPALVAQCIDECCVGFLFAPKHHSAMRHVAKARAGLAMRTLFNLLGPLTNPAGAEFQLMGVFDKAWCKPMAQALKELGTKRAWVVHGSDGMDELTVTGKSHVTELKDGKITSMTIDPKELGLGIYKLEDLKGGNSKTNSEKITALFAGEKGSYHDIVVLNSGAALYIYGAVESLQDGVNKAAQAIASGKAMSTLASLVRVSYQN